MTTMKLERQKPTCLIVDDDVSIRKTLCLALEVDGWSVRGCDDIYTAQQAIQDTQFDLALVDLRLGTQSGLDLLPMLSEAQPGIPIIMITAHATISTAVEAMRLGAVDYLTKPFTPIDVRRAATQALAFRASQSRESDLESQMLLVSTAPAVREVFTEAREVAASSTAILIRGNTGTGKGVLARAIHNWSPRSSRPFVVLSCPSLPAEMLESDIFGHVQGAFDGADREHNGRIAQAEGGTLFLDEIGVLPMDVQLKLLRLLQVKEYERLGENETRKADVRIVAATHLDLKEAIRAGRFREDLYFRLNVVELVLPPLSERLEDIEGLATIMLANLNRESGSGPLRLDPDVLKLFQSYAWPGNMRELQNILERASVWGEGDEVTLKHLLAAFGSDHAVVPSVSEELASLEELEQNQIRKVLSKSGTLIQAARILGLNTATLWRKRRKYKL
jgi:NtrC-family two-component system response regulator AlgB